MLERIKRHPLSVLTTLAACAWIMQSTFPEFPQIAFWSGKAQTLLLGLSTVLSGKNLIVGKK